MVAAPCDAGERAEVHLWLGGLGWNGEEWGGVPRGGAGGPREDRGVPLGWDPREAEDSETALYLRAGVSP